MLYLLDTNICIYIAKRKPQRLMERLRKAKSEDAGMSVITYFELMYGAWKSEYRDMSLSRIEALRRLIAVAPLDDSAGSNFGRIRAELERKGTPIGPYDLLIAAHALTLGVTLVTNNAREFSRIEGLKVENWAD